MIKETVGKEDITILTIYAPIYETVSKYTKKRNKKKSKKDK